MKLIDYNGATINRTDSIRLLLSHARIDFEDELISTGLYNQMKQFGFQLPSFEMNNKVLNYNTVILRTLGIKYGYYPTKPI